jgi:D-glycero-D-manno-heptose 1,7-bisphosphate phosphatase
LITKGLRGKAIRNFGFIRDAGTPERLREVNSKFKSKLTNSKKKRLALFDRDGTINLSKGYITDFNQIELCVGVGDLIRWLNDNDFYVAVLTNQPGIARGEASFSDVDLIHARIDFLLAEFNAFIDAYFICPHHPHSGFKGEIRDLKMICYCRKPSKGLAEKCFEYFALRPKDSIMIGDSWRDQELASELQVQFFEINERNSEERYEEILGTLQKNFSLE